MRALLLELSGGRSRLRGGSEWYPGRLHLLDQTGELPCILGEATPGSPSEPFLASPLLCYCLWLEVQPAGAEKLPCLCGTNTRAIENGPSDSRWRKNAALGP